MACPSTTRRNPAILFEHGDYHMIAVPTGFEVYKNMGTHSQRVGQYGKTYYDRAKQDILDDRWAKVGVFKGKKNPGFLPKSLFDRYVIRVVGEDYKVDRIQTLAGAEHKLKQVAKKFPCNSIEIVSEKFGTVVKSYRPSGGAGTPKVDKDNSRDYKAKEKQAVKDDVKFVLYLDGQEYATYDTKKEAEQVGKKEGGRVRVKEVRGNARRGNPELDERGASDLFESFHGVPSTGALDYEESFVEPDAYAELGDLIELWVIPIHAKGNKAIKIEAPNPDEVGPNEVVKLASSPEANQLYFIGGDQSLDVRAMGFTSREERSNMFIGVLAELTYRAKKKFHKLKLTDYYHKLGEESGNEPILIYDAHSEKMAVAGGNYEVRDVGIVD